MSRKPKEMIWKQSPFARIDDYTAAVAGDRKAILEMLRQCVTCYEDLDDTDHDDCVIIPRKVHMFVRAAFGEILGGKTPNEAFGWSKCEGGRPPLTWIDELDRQNVAALVHEHREADPVSRGALKRAILRVQKFYRGIYRGESFTTDQIRDAYRALYPNEGKTP